jgi:delta14-sterol reductase
VTSYAWWAKLWDAQAFLVFVAWMVYIFIAWAILPGDWVEGTLLRNGTRQKYKINGEGCSGSDVVIRLNKTSMAAFSTLLLTLGLVAGVIVRGGPQAFTWIYEHYLGLITASVIYSFIQSVLLYALSFRGEKLLALGGNSDSHIYNVCVTLIARLVQLDLLDLSFGWDEN